MDRTTIQHPHHPHLRRFNRMISMIAVALAGTSLLRKAMFDIKSDGMTWRNLRRLDSNNATDLEAMSIQFYIKTSGIERYFNRSKRMVEYWGKDTDGKMTLLLDNHNKESVDAFGEEHPYLSIVHVGGTDNQRKYKYPNSEKDAKEAYKAQRIKTRAVFEDFESLESKPDWVCYLDDDMFVNVQNLKLELSQLWHECSPDCFVADGMKHIKGFPYTAGGYCMERDLASRVEKLLHENTDEEMEWTGTDDVHFNIMLKKKLNVTRINSDLWYSQLSTPDVKSDGIEKVTYFHPKFKEMAVPTWGEERGFMESWVPMLSVFNQQYMPPKNVREILKLES